MSFSVLSSHSAKQQRALSGCICALTAEPLWWKKPAMVLSTIFAKDILTSRVGHSSRNGLEYNRTYFVNYKDKTNLFILKLKTISVHVLTGNHTAPQKAMRKRKTTGKLKMLDWLEIGVTLRAEILHQPGTRAFTSHHNSRDDAHPLRHFRPEWNKRKRLKENLYIQLWADLCSFCRAIVAGLATTL